MQFSFCIKCELRRTNSKTKVCRYCQKSGFNGWKKSEVVNMDMAEKLAALYESKTGEPADLIDFRAEADNSLTYRENKAHIEEITGANLGAKENPKTEYNNEIKREAGAIEAGPEEAVLSDGRKVVLFAQSKEFYCCLLKPDDSIIECVFYPEFMKAKTVFESVKASGKMPDEIEEAPNEAKEVV